MGPHVAEEAPLDPGYCRCGLSLDHSDHIQAAPKPDGAAFVKRKRIKDFIDRHGEWIGEQRRLRAKSGAWITYTHAGVDAVPDNELDQEIVDVLWAHCDRGTCRGCNADIWWIRNAEKKAVPYSRAGVVHFQDCPARGQFKKGA